MLFISVPAGRITALGLRSLICLLYSKQHLINRSTGGDSLRIDDAAIAQLRTAWPKSPEAFSAALKELQEQALVSGLDFDGVNITLSFPWQNDLEAVGAYSELTEHVIRTAWGMKKARLITDPPEIGRPEGEKFYMNTWLIRLGMKGRKHAGARYIILKRLNGHIGFRNEADAEKSRNMVREMRKVKHEVFAEER